MKQISLKINKRFVFDTKAIKEWLNKEIREVELIIDGNVVEKQGFFESNHSIGCNLEGYAQLLRYRGKDVEARQLDEIAARLK